MIHHSLSRDIHEKNVDKAKHPSELDTAVKSPFITFNLHEYCEEIHKEKWRWSSPLIRPLPDGPTENVQASCRISKLLSSKYSASHRSEKAVATTWTHGLLKILVWQGAEVFVQAYEDDNMSSRYGATYERDKYNL